MSYVVLARKWRPQTLDDVVGQETVTRTLRNALTSGRLGHAFLLTGARGVGKTSTARILAKALNCSTSKDATADPCGVCASCVEVAAGTSLDVQEIDGATHNSVDDVRGLRESAQFNPARDRFRIWIIDEVHMLSSGAFNALLKTLEEPPPRVKFILATTEMRKLPETILSRCQIHAFRLLPAKGLAAHLKEIAGKEKIQISDAALLRLAQAADGSVRDALSLFDQVLAFTGPKVQDADVVELLGLIDRDLLTRATRAVIDNDSVAALGVCEALASFGADYRQFARDLLLYWRDLLVLKVSPDSETGDLMPEDRERALAFTRELSEEDVLRMCDLLARAEIDLRQALDPRVALELTLLKAAQTRRLVPFADLVARVEALAGGAPPSGPAPAPRGDLRGPAPRTATPMASGAPAPTAPVALSGAVNERLRLAAGNGLLGSVLSQSTAEVEGDRLVLRVPAAVEAPAISQIGAIENLAEKALGTRLKVKVVGGGPAAEAPAQTSAPARGLAAETPPAERPTSKDAGKSELRARAAKDKGVQEALSLFGGEIVDVKPLATGEGTKTPVDDAPEDEPER